LARKILLADDSVTAQSMGRRILTEAGYEVLTVNNGSAALKKVAEQPPDLLVLDVYMPGYGGLEVCQRLKNASETAAIPVLLTVGKLEPFKAEEARRVQADSYLVKPFEASELIAAIIKLEDKIVPKAEAQPPASFAKALAAMEQSATAAPGSKFGDAHSGWKDRLRIPRPSRENERKEAEAEAVPTKPPDAMAFRDFVRPDAAPAAESAIPKELLQNMTSDEIAAITAAAAAFGAEAESPEAEAPSPVLEASSPAESSIAEAPQEAMPQQEAAQEEAAQEEAVSRSAEAESSFVPAPELESSAELAAEAVAEAAPEQSAVPEVSAAPTSEAAQPAAEPAAVDAPAVQGQAAPEPFVPAADGIMDAIWRQTEETVRGSSREELVAATEDLNASSAPQPAAWIAEEVPVSQEEISILEQEMQKAYAAMAQESLASLSAEMESMAMQAAPVEAPSADSVSAVAEETAVSAAAEEFSSAEAIAAQPEEPPAVAAEEETQAAAEIEREAVAVEDSAPAVMTEAQPVAAVEESPAAAEAEPQAGAEAEQAPVQEAESAAEPEAEPVPAEAAPAAEIAEEPQAETVEAIAEPPAEFVSEPAAQADAVESESAPVEAVASESHPEATLAAAASAAAGTSAFAVSTSMVSAESESALQTSAPQASAEGVAPALDPQREAELAAAWAQWREIRDTVAGPGMTSQLADVAAAGLQEPQPGVAAHSDEASAPAPAGPDAIASIVDSVLSELKPRLVEEIARKLGQKK
jgi:CheY-like chemotaxis protein